METQPLLQRTLAWFFLDLTRLTVWLVLLAGIFALIESRWALHPQKFLRKAFGTDLVYYFLSAITPKLVLLVPMTMLAAAVHRFEPAPFYTWVAAMPGWLRLALAMFAGDIGAYWGHRWMHEIPLLWRFHSLHHSAEEMDWLVNSRAHPVDMVFTRLCGWIPMYVLGLAQPTGNRLDWVPMVVTIAGTVWGFFIHANVNWRLGWFEELLSSPAFHHWHHTNDGPRFAGKNYAAVFPFVDRTFGTFYLPSRQWPVKYGTDTVIPSRLTGQLLQPLVPRVAGPGWYRSL